jgi:heme/copper-type cytochrome/quinol oxidase subunit 3
MPMRMKSTELLEATGRFELPMGLLQSPALPLGYVAVMLHQLGCARDASMERVVGIEPTHQPWEGRRLPLHHTRAPQRSSGSSTTAFRPTNLHFRATVALKGRRPAEPKVRDVTWVYIFPPWLLFALVLVAMVVLSVAGLLVYRYFVPEREDLTHNDVAGPIISAVGTILAVILSFLLVTVWQEYDSAASTVETESSAVSDLYHSAAYFPPAVGKDVRSQLLSYVNAIVYEEWPEMRTGSSSNDVRRISLHIMATVARYSPTTSAQQTLQQAALSDVHTFQDARRDRLFDNAQGIPIIFWAGNLLLASITIGLCYIFRVRNVMMHVLMTAALAAVIGAIFVLIAEFDYPFRGTGQIPPTSFTHLQKTLPSLTESD